MKPIRRRALNALLVAVTLTWTGCGRPTAPPTAAGSAELQIIIHGGFAYVPTVTEQRVEVAYLKDTNVAGCQVDQLGTELVVDAGTIVEPNPPPGTRTFNLASAVVTFPDLESANIPLNAGRGSRPGPPYKPSTPNEWDDLKWVPGISPDFPSSSLNPEWRNLVDGRVVLKGGRIKGLAPSQSAIRNAVFEFRKGGVAAYQHAITERTEYSVRVPSDRVVMHLSGAASGVTRIVVTPPAPGQPVVLRLNGQHSAQTPAELALGEPVTDFCAFYQLLQPVPPEPDWLIPHFMGDASIPSGGVQPSPGPFCPGDWF